VKLRWVKWNRVKLRSSPSTVAFVALEGWEIIGSNHAVILDTSIIKSGLSGTQARIRHLIVS